MQNGAVTPVCKTYVFIFQKTRCAADAARRKRDLRRWVRALALPVVASVGAGTVALTVGIGVWVWPVLVLLAAFSVFLAVDRSRSLGHRVGGGWLVARAGSMQRRRDCVAAPGIVGWTVRQSWPQRRLCCCWFTSGSVVSMCRRCGRLQHTWEP